MTPASSLYHGFQTAAGFIEVLHLSPLAHSSDRVLHNSGQAVVQIVQEVQTKEEYAMKFFLSSGSFEKETDLYLDSSKPLGQLLPQLRTIVDGKGRNVVQDAFGRPLPPCIVMEKGEALDVWIESSGSLDMFTGLQVQYSAACVYSYVGCCGFNLSEPCSNLVALSPAPDSLSLFMFVLLPSNMSDIVCTCKRNPFMHVSGSLACV